MGKLLCFLIALMILRNSEMAICWLLHCAIHTYTYVPTNNPTLAIKEKDLRRKLPAANLLSPNL